MGECTNSEYDPLSIKDMSVIVNMISKVPDLRDHGQTICSALKLKSWCQLLKGLIGERVDPSTKEEVQMSDELPLKRTQ